MLIVETYPQRMSEHIKSWWHSDAIWRHRSGPTLAQIMAWCLTAPSHYLSQCYLIANKVIWGHFHDKIWRYQSVSQDWKYHYQNCIQISQGTMSYTDVVNMVVCGRINSEVMPKIISTSISSKGASDKTLLKPFTALNWFKDCMLNNC